MLLSQNVRTAVIANAATTSTYVKKDFTMQHLNIDRVISSLEARGVRVVAAVTDFAPVTKTLARVIVTCTNADNASQHDIRQAIASATGNTASPILKSFHAVNSNGLPAYVGFVKANTSARPYERKEVAKMRVMAKNMLMDTADDSLWEVRSDTSGNRMLVRQNQDDLSTLLSSVKQSVPRAPKVSHLASVANVGDAIMYVDPRKEVVRAGFVLSVEDGDDGEALEIVQAPEQNNPDAPKDLEEVVDLQNEAFASAVIPSSVVVSAVSFPTRFFSKEVAAPANPNNKQALKDYYKKIWSQGNPEFLKRLFENIDRMAAA